MEMDGLDEVYKLQRFLPTPEEAVGYFLPCLLRGETMHGAEKLIRHAQVYACEPKDLARQFAPVPTAVSSGDRFFFTTCKRNAKNGQWVRAAGGGTWVINTTKNVYDKDGETKIGEARNLSFKKGKGKDKVCTGWVMEEYRCLLPEAVVAQGEMVLCRIHLAANLPAAARQESDAYRLHRQEPAEQAPAPQPAAEPVAVAASAHAQKRPAPVSASDMSSCCKKMRIIAAPVPVPEPEVEYEDCPMWPAAPVSTLLAASTEVREADDHTDGLSCSWEQIFGEEHQTLPPVEAQNMEQLVSDQSMLAGDWGAEVQEEERSALPVEAQNNNQQLDSDEDIDYGQLVASFLADLPEEEAELHKMMCNYNADLQGQHSQFFSSAPIN